MENEQILSLYLVAPKDHEYLCAVVVAPDEETAKYKASTNPKVKELSDLGVQLISVNISTTLSTQGYNVAITRQGMFH